MRTLVLVAAVCGVIVDGCSQTSPPQVIQIVAGSGHSCALRSDGRVFCWGLNDDGELGDGTTTTSSTPVPVALAEPAISIAAGGYHTCALTTAGATYCWGSNLTGQLGDGTTVNRSTPVVVGGLVATEVVGGTDFTCAKEADGSVDCWGDNYHLQTGNSDPTVPHPSPSKIAISGATEIVATYDGACAIIAGGEVWCWGGADSLGLGGDPLFDSAVPVRILDWPSCFPCGNTTPSPITGATLLSGSAKPCAVLADGSVACWGGIDTTLIPDIAAPTMIADGFPTAPELMINEQHCGVIDGSLACWAWQYATCTNSTCEISVPPVTGLAGVVATTAGGDCILRNSVVSCDHHACTLNTTGAVQCWGANTFGELGDGTTTDSMTPVTVVGLDQPTR